MDQAAQTTISGPKRGGEYCLVDPALTPEQKQIQFHSLLSRAIDLASDLGELGAVAYLRLAQQATRFPNPDLVS